MENRLRKLDIGIIDSAQIVDFIDKNEKLCTDIGSGSGLPGKISNYETQKNFNEI